MTGHTDGPDNGRQKTPICGKSSLTAGADLRIVGES